MVSSALPKTFMSSARHYLCVVVELTSLMLTANLVVGHKAVLVLTPWLLQVPYFGQFGGKK